MANRTLFQSSRGRLAPRADAANREGAPAYAYTDAHALVQGAMTGTFGGTFYADAPAELDRLVDLAGRVEPAFLARAAVYTRQRGHMKDAPAVLLAVLARRDPALFRAVFARVVDNGRMLRTFVQVVRSGQTGRRSLGTRPKAMVAGWLNTASDRALVRASIGRDPSLADILRMVHPRPATPAREALFAWILGRPADVARLPQPLQDWLAFKAALEAGEAGEIAVPDVPFQMLTQLPLQPRHWAGIARQGSWQMLRMNLNTFLRHGVFDDPAMVAHVARVLADPAHVRGARAFPYQLMVAARAVSAEMPGEIAAALGQAMEHAVANVPALDGRVAVCPDVSGSMTWPVTGWRPGATSAVRHVDVAALVAAAVLRRNPGAEVLPFDTAVRRVRLAPGDSVATNAERLAALGGGGTACAAPLEWLAARGRAPDTVILVSDNQSWADWTRSDLRLGGGTAVMRAWERLKAKNPKARLVCLDIAPYGTTQAPERDDVLNIGGFSDSVFDQLAAFARGRMGPGHWMAEIEAIAL
ncbi:MAG: RNA-binding protein [Pseudomonadota bacterium]